MDPDLTSVDVYLPPGCDAVPVVMWVHGGGWRRGDKANGNVERKAAWAESIGAALVSVDYRLTTLDSGVRWPDHGEDVAASPNVQLERNGPPSTRFLVGARGGPRRVADAQTFVDLVNDSGGSAELLDANPYTHNQIISQLAASDDRTVTPAASEFVRSCT